MTTAALTTTRFTEASPAECYPVAWSHAGTHHTEFARQGRLAPEFLALLAALVIAPANIVAVSVMVTAA